MAEHKYTIGVDFGTESGRAVLVDVSTGQELATAVHWYKNGVIDQALPESSIRLEPDWALQDPNDYIEVFRHAIPAVLEESGVDPANVFMTGYPLPEENTGGGSLAILKADLGRRLLRLDPMGRFFSRYRSLVSEKVGLVSSRTNDPVTILFSIGGAGAQRDIGAALVGSLREMLARRDVRVVLGAGVKPAVRDYLQAAVTRLGLETGPAAGVEILYADRISEYFRIFNEALRATDVLWTKPSELSFFTALGLPIVMAPPLGSQEHANREWLLEIGSAVSQQDPRYANEWLLDLVASGWFAEAALQGFIDGTQLGTPAIRAVITGAQPEGSCLL